jgi:hypothetical protein
MKIYTNRRRRRAFGSLEEMAIVMALSAIFAVGVAVAGISMIGRASLSKVEEAATTFNSRVLEVALADAASGSSDSSITNPNTRSATLIADLLSNGDAPRSVSMSVNSAAALNPPFKIWDGKKVCDFSGTCLLPADVVEGDVASYITATPTYVQFVKGGSSVCLRLSSNSVQATDGSDLAGWTLAEKVKKGSSTSPDTDNACNKVTGAGSGW